MLESSLGIICKPLSDRSVGRYIPAQIISPIRGLGNNSKVSTIDVSQQLLCVKSTVLNASPSVLGKITRTFFLPQHNYGFLKCFASVTSTGCVCVSV